jgi:glycosyltransferase involved in cell wall biosynthesis
MRTDSCRRFLILVAMPFPDGNSVGRAAHMIAKALESQGVKVVVLSRWSSGTKQKPVESTISVVTFGHVNQYARLGSRAGIGRWVWIKSTMGIALASVWRVAIGGADGVIVYGPSPLFLPAVAVACVLRRPFAYAQYDLYRPSSQDYWWKQRAAALYESTERFFARHASLLLLSESELLLRRFAELAPNSPAFPNWPPIDFGFFANGNPECGRDLCGVQPGTPLIVYVGAISRLEGVDILIEAMKEVAAAIPEARLIIAGAVWPDILPGLPPDFTALPNKYGIADKVRFLGVVDKERVRNLLAAADCLVMPKRAHEGNEAASPIKLGEYLASGRPVVASRVCGIEKWLKAGREILFCEPGNSGSLARVITTVLRHPEWAGRIAKRGRPVGEEHCSYQRWGERMVQAWVSIRK